MEPFPSIHRILHATCVSLQNVCMLVCYVSHCTEMLGGACSRMSTSFGYLNKIGYKGFRFPIVIGESGSRYTDVSHPSP